MADHKHKSKTAYAYENLKCTYALLGGKNSRMFNILGHEGHLQVESKISMLYSVFGQCQGFLDWLTESIIDLLNFISYE